MTPLLHNRVSRRLLWLPSLFIALAAPAVVVGTDPSAPPHWLIWTETPELASVPNAEGAFLGKSNGVVIVAGGAGTPTEAPSDRIQILVEESTGVTHWEVVGQLPHPTHQGASVTVPAGLICIGGRTTTANLSDVRLLRWDAIRSQVTIEDLPPLPQPLSRVAATALGDRIFVLGGQDESGNVIQDVWSLQIGDPAGWTPQPTWDGPGRMASIAVTQRGGEYPLIFIFGGTDGKNNLTDVHRYDPRRDEWQRVADMPDSAFPAPASAMGQSHVAIFSSGDGKGLAPSTLIYHTITDTWTHAPPIPAPAIGSVALRYKNGFLVPSRETAYLATLQGSIRHFSSLDFVVLVVYLAALVGIGIAFTKCQHTSRDFFLAGQKIPWWAAGLSLMATQVSAIGFMAVPAKSYATNWLYFTGSLVWFVIVPIVTVGFIPFFRRLNITSAYEYLEFRFNLAARLFAAIVFSVVQLGRMAVVLYLPALALTSVTDMDLQMSIIAMGVLATVYTATGGMAAVVWTDVVQALVLLGGALLCIIWVIFSIDGGLSGLLGVAVANDKFHFAELEWDFTIAALWVVLLGNVFSRLSVLISDQSIVQRYMSTPTEKQAKQALWTDALVSIPWAVLVFMLGTALFVYYRAFPEKLSPMVDADGIVPLFIAQQLPVGVTGLIIAAIFAAAMSSLDSAMHSTATVWVNDGVARLRPSLPDRSKLFLARGFVVVLGFVGTGTALWMATANILSLWDFFMSLLGLLLSGLGGLFLLGIFTRRTSGTGALIGAVASAFLTLMVRNHTHVHFFLYAVIGIISCVVIGYLASCLLPRVPTPPGLTYGDPRPIDRPPERESMTL